MAVSFVSPLHLSFTLIPPRRVICGGLRTQAPPPPPPPSPSIAAPPQPLSSLSLNPNLGPNDLNSSSRPSLACALQCPHFQSYVLLSVLCFTPSIPICNYSCFFCYFFSFFVDRCSGCTHEYDLHHPKVVDEAANFLKSLGLLDFTFDSCRLVCQYFVYGTLYSISRFCFG